MARIFTYREEIGILISRVKSELIRSNNFHEQIVLRIHLKNLQNKL